MKIKLVLMALAVCLFSFAPSDPPEPQAYLPIVCKSEPITVTVCPNAYLWDMRPAPPSSPWPNLAIIRFAPQDLGRCVEAVEVYNTKYEEPLVPDKIWWQSGGIVQPDGTYVTDFVTIWFPLTPNWEPVDEPAIYTMRFNLRLVNGCTYTIFGEGTFWGGQWYNWYPINRCSY
jgi:hypothetical protein